MKRIRKSSIIKLIGLVFLITTAIPGCKNVRGPHEPVKKDYPNIILILADDMGYGDISALNPDSKIQTPNIDRLVSEGIYFTDAHAPVSVCTPTRYGILTGRYCFRSRLKSGVLVGHSPSLIEPGRMTLASLLKNQGYHTGCIGKWHLGLDWKKKDIAKPLYEGNDWDITNTSNVDYRAQVEGGPTDHGFDHSFILPASLDIQPYCFISNKLVVDPDMNYIDDLNMENIEDFRNHHGLFWRHGDISAGFDFWNVLPECTSKTIEFITDHCENHPLKPFFLYFPLTAPHTPWVPLENFKGRSGAGEYGDFTVQVDHSVGEILNLLDSLNITENTLIIVTSDNGAYWPYSEIIQYKHRSNHVFRGMKTDVWEGGHRMPFIVRWPDVIAGGHISDKLVSLTDFLATFAEIVGEDIPYNTGEDSFSFLSELTGNTGNNVMRSTLIMQSGFGMYAIRKDNWKLILGKGSGGWSSQGSPEDPPGQLYDMKNDISETTNLYEKHPEIVKKLTELFEMYQKEGRSRYE